jgi:tetratricopeptide (TPR) repeat protein
MLNKPRVRRPYEKKQVSKAGAVIFGVGLASLAFTFFILVGLMMPYFNTKLDNLSSRIRTYTQKFVPHRAYLPTPAPVIISFSPPTDTPPALTELTAPTSSAGEPSSTTTIADAAAIPAAVEITNDPTPIENNLLVTDSLQTQLTGFNHQWQTWNNCGPATITMYTSYFGRPETQVEAAQFLKPNRDDKNVRPEELATYAQTIGLQAMVRQGGNLTQLKSFINNGLPVLVETWLIHDGDGLGHYRLITGYDEATRQFITTDSLNGPDYAVSYEQFDQDWRVFNRLYIVVYPQEQSPIVAAIIGDAIDKNVMYERLVAEAQAEIEANPNDAIAYFNQGEALTRLDRPAEAVVAFDQARRIGLHWRRLWYQFTPFEAYYTTGRYQDVLDLAEATLEGTDGLEEVYYYQGLALQAMGQPGAADSFQAAIAYNPNFSPANEALNQLLSQP